MRPWHIAARPAAVAAVLLALTVAGPALAQNPPRLGGPLVDGSVTRSRGCGSHFLIAYRDEYALLEWLGGEMPRDGDVLQGVDDQTSFEREGRATLINLATGATLEVMIAKALLNRADYTKTVAQFCH
jgi:hypothetical protein